MSKLIMLDFDGVIADSLEATSAATIKAMEERGMVDLVSQEMVPRLVESNWFDGLRKAGVPLEVSDDIDDIVAEAVSAGELQPYVVCGGHRGRHGRRPSG